MGPISSLIPPEMIHECNMGKMRQGIPCSIHLCTCFVTLTALLSWHTLSGSWMMWMSMCCPTKAKGHQYGKTITLMCAYCSASPMKTRQQNPDKSGLRPTILLLSFLTHTLGCWETNLTLLSYFQG